MLLLEKRIGEVRDPMLASAISELNSAAALFLQPALALGRP
jgi:hypothetical protein